MMLKPDKALLEDLIAQAENLNEADYEAQSFAVMRTALAAAKDVFENEAATQEEIDASAAELKDAIAKLTAADSGEDQQGGNTGSTDQTGGAVSSTEPPTLVSSGQNSDTLYAGNTTAGAASSSQNSGSAAKATKEERGRLKDSQTGKRL